MTSFSVQRSLKIVSRSVLLLAIAALGACDGNLPMGLPPAPPEVGVVTLEATSVTFVSVLPGRGRAFAIAEVRPQVGGLLKQRLFEEGAEVEAGQVLYRIDDAPFAAVLARAEATLARASAAAAVSERTLSRYRDLITIDAISAEELSQAEAAHELALADLKAARAEVELARINLGYTTIRAPISGRIGRSSVTVGALLSANQPAALATIQQLDPIYIDFNQSSADLLRLRQALRSGSLTPHPSSAEVQLRLEDDSIYPQPALLQLSEIAVDQGSGSVTLRAVASNPDQLLLPGMFVRAQLTEGVAERALLVPQRGVTRDPRGQATALIVLPDNTVAQRVIKTVRSYDGAWVVEEGLAVGDRVIVEGLQRVRPGAIATPVEYVPAHDPSADTDAQPTATRG